ncbi:hypothetical protein ACWEV4_29655 [Streptomyces sp. NPDC003860]
MSQHQPGTRAQALVAHTAHAAAKAGPTRGPSRVGLGLRVTVLVMAMLMIWGTCYLAGRAIAQDFTDAAAQASLAASHLTGLALAFGLMVAVRHYIAPTRI